MLGSMWPTHQDVSLQGLFSCNDDCLPSAIEAFRFFYWVVFFTTAFYAVLIPLSLFIEFCWNSISQKRLFSLANYNARKRTVAGFRNLCRDIVFAILFLSVWALILFWSSASYYGVNGHDIIVDSELTDYGLKLKLYQFFQFFLVALFFFFVCRVVDRFSLGSGAAKPVTSLLGESTDDFQ
jgi:hypothetical protein